MPPSEGPRLFVETHRNWVSSERVYLSEDNHSIRNILGKTLSGTWVLQTTAATCAWVTGSRSALLCAQERRSPRQQALWTCRALSTRNICMNVPQATSTLLSKASGSGTTESQGQTFSQSVLWKNAICSHAKQRLHASGRTSNGSRKESCWENPMGINLHQVTAKPGLMSGGRGRRVSRVSPGRLSPDSDDGLYCDCKQFSQWLRLLFVLHLSLIICHVKHCLHDQTAT